MKVFRSFLVLFMYYISCATLVAVAASPEMFTVDGVSSAIMIATAAGGVGIPFSFNMTYLPEFFSYNNGGNELTSLRIETQEDGVIHDYVAASIAAVNGFGKVGDQAANEVLLTLANGHIEKKNVTISGVTSAAGAINFFVSSDNKGTNAFRLNTAQILANNPTTFEKFTALFVPSAVTAVDRFEIEFEDGHRQTFDILELQRLASFYQQVQGTIINNKAGYIKKVIATCAAARPAYQLSVIIPGQA